ncbi:MAG: cardiolipin synthase [Kiloniellales bacterium]
MQIDLTYLHFIGIVLLYAASAACVVHAIMDTRTSQGAVAWVIGLISFPILALPLYLIFGRRKFIGYVQARRLKTDQLHKLEALGHVLCPHSDHRPDAGLGTIEALESLAMMPFTRGNGVTLLVDGQATFDAIFAEIDRAESYVLVQFYIFRDDGLGQRFRDHLLAARKRGVDVYLLYDEIGSSKTSKNFFQSMRDQGISVASFNSDRSRPYRRQINFRNHRKIVVVDSRVAFVGGHNVGDEYLGLDPKFGRWRDTHVALRGPIVEACQVSFYEDWYWSQGKRLELDWTFDSGAGEDRTALVLPSGPADIMESGSLFFLQLIGAAQERLWIISPYFVPDQAIVSALQLAALRGVDVRIIIPDKADHLVVWLAAFSYLKEAEEAGIKIYRYTGGFLHQKVILVDDRLAGVGTANLDNRSLRLNFEITVLFADRAFAGEVDAMLREDLANSRLYHDQELIDRSWPFRFAVRAARLAAPIL